MLPMPLFMGTLVMVGLMAVRVSLRRPSAVERRRSGERSRQWLVTS